MNIFSMNNEIMINEYFVGGMGLLGLLGFLVQTIPMSCPENPRNPTSKLKSRA